MIQYYVIIETKDILQEMVEESCNKSDTFRKSLDGSKGILKFHIPFPNTMGGYEKKTHTEIRQYLADNYIEWAGADE